jgi:hypothetical protein
MNAAYASGTAGSWLSVCGVVFPSEGSVPSAGRGASGGTASVVDAEGVAVSSLTDSLYDRPDRLRV